MRFLILLILFVSANVQAQHSLVMTRPLDFNGGLVGNLEKIRINTNIHSIGSHCTSNESNSSYGGTSVVGVEKYGVRDLNYFGYNSSISVDMLSKKLKGGIGISLKTATSNQSYDHIYDYKVEFISKSTSLNFTYSPKLLFKQNISISPFIQAGAYYQNTQNSVWGDYLKFEENQGVRGVSNVFHNHYSNSKHFGVNLSFGFLINKETWFLGYKNVGLHSGIKKPLKSMYNVFQAGKLFNLYKNHRYGLGFLINTPIVFTYNRSSLGTPELFRSNLLTYLKISNFSIGIDPVSYYGMTYFVNYKHKNYTFGYSIDSNNHEYGGNKHEIGFQYLFKKKEEDKLLSIPIKN